MWILKHEVVAGQHYPVRSLVSGLGGPAPWHHHQDHDAYGEADEVAQYKTIGGHNSGLLTAGIVQQLVQSVRAWPGPSR